jgi:hypothetical protein
MRKSLAIITLALSLGTIAAAPALADVSTTQHLPTAACNAGTMNTYSTLRRRRSSPDGASSMTTNRQRA